MYVIEPIRNLLGYYDKDRGEGDNEVSTESESLQSIARVPVSIFSCLGPEVRVGS